MFPYFKVSDKCHGKQKTRLTKWSKQTSEGEVLQVTGETLRQSGRAAGENCRMEGYPSSVWRSAWTLIFRNIFIFIPILRKEQ